MNIDVSRKSILTILHSNYLKNNAGIEKVVLEQQNICMDLGITFISVFPLINVLKIGSHHIYIKTGKYALIIDGKLKGYYIFAKLKEIINKINLEAVIIHQLMGYKHNNCLIKFIKSFVCPIYYYIHDYSTICYNNVLLKNNKVYCGCSRISLRKCYNCRFFVLGLIDHQFYKNLFNKCETIQFVFPSNTIKKIWLDVFGDKYKNKCRVIPNEKFSDEVYELNKDTKFEKIRIAYIGYQNIVKGWESFKKINNINKDQFELFVLGRCTEQLEGVKVIPVSFIDNGPNAMVNAIKDNNIDIAFLWSIRPETYGFTFYESYISGTYIITNNNSGNITYMTKKLNCGKSFESDIELFDFLSDFNCLKNELKDYYGKNTTRSCEMIANDEIFSLFQVNTGDSIE
ncbi:MAG: hypothetical protein ACPKNR_04050 [Pleomorphochaeta sp.]